MISKIAKIHPHLPNCMHVLLVVVASKCKVEEIRRAHVKLNEKPHLNTQLNNFETFYKQAIILDCC